MRVAVLSVGALFPLWHPARLVARSKSFEFSSRSRAGATQRAQRRGEPERPFSRTFSRAENAAGSSRRSTLAYSYESSVVWHDDFRVALGARCGALGQVAQPRVLMEVL